MGKEGPLPVSPRDGRPPENGQLSLLSGGENKLGAVFTDEDDAFPGDAFDLSLIHI